MNELPSTEFRKTFARLTTATVVTANGHPIGTWTPIGAEWTHLLPPVPEEVKALAPPGTRVEFDTRPLSETALAVDTTPRSRQTKRDELLRKINRSR